MTDQEFILYLKVIQDECTDRYYCDGCKYYTTFGCAFKHIPADWSLDELSKKNRRENETMTCNNCMCAKGKIIKMCDIFNAPCYDPYSNIDKCKNWACKYYKTIEIEGSATNGDKKVKLCKQ